MNASAKFLYIKRFREFQHYHTRGAPWIKLYASLLEDAAFLSLSEAAQAQLMKLWLLASQFGHPLPNNPRLIAGKIGATGRFHLQAMIDAGFLIPSDDHASTNASESASTDASDSDSTDASNFASATHARVPERRELRGERTETTKDPSSSGASVFDRLILATHRESLAAVLAAVPNPGTWEREIAARLDGMHGPPITPIQLGEALVDYDANGNLSSPNFKHFRGYLDKAARPKEPGSTAANGNAKREQNGPGERTYHNAKIALEDL